MIKTKTIIQANIYYWLITNFMCWWAWYTHDMIGFVSCYILAIPFFFTALFKTWAVVRIVEYVVHKVCEHPARQA